jgi:long-subunit fatty acid transport protein
VAYEESAIPDATYEPGIPTTDSVWLNLGTRYWHSNNAFFDIGLSRIFYDDRQVNLSGLYGETLRGETQSSLYAINVQGNWAF